MNQYAVGVDGGKKTGFAVWDCVNGNFVTIRTTTFWKLFTELISKHHLNPTNTVFYVEDPSQNRPVFRYPNMKDYELIAKAQSVGGVKRESDLLIEGLQFMGFSVKRLKPGKGSWTKMNANKFQQIAKYSGRTSEHGRDAAMLVFKRKPIRVNQCKQ